MRAVRILAIAILGSGAVVTLSATAAHADANTVKAKQLFEEGVTNYNLGHFEEALTNFEMAYRLRHDAAFLFNIAQCQRNLRRYEEAQRTYRAYLRESPDLPPGTKAQVQQIMADLERAQAEDRSKKAATGTPSPAMSPPAPVVTAQPVQTSAPVAQAVAEHKAPPARKRTWVWGVVAGAVVAVGLGVGLGIGLSNHDKDPTATFGVVSAR